MQCQVFRQFWAASGVRCRTGQEPCVYALARLRGLVLSLRVTPYTALSTGCRLRCIFLIVFGVAARLTVRTG